MVRSGVESLTQRATPPPVPVFRLGSIDFRPWLARARLPRNSTAAARPVDHIAGAGYCSTALRRSRGPLRRMGRSGPWPDARPWPLAPGRWALGAGPSELDGLHAGRPELVPGSPTTTQVQPPLPDTRTAGVTQYAS